MKLRCKIFGKFTHKWRYFKSNKNSEFRVCRFCGHTQEYVSIPDLTFMYTKRYVWMDCVERTKLGAEERIKEINNSVFYKKGDEK